MIGLPQAFRDLPTDQIDTKAVFAVLEPFWDLEPETARRLRGRIEAVLDYRANRTTADRTRRRGRDGSRPSWGAAQDQARQEDWRARSARAPSMPPCAGRTFRRSSRSCARSISPRAGRSNFSILTASRTGEVIDMPWNKVDFVLARDKALKPDMVQPSDRRKMDRDHHVPPTRPRGRNPAEANGLALGVELRRSPLRVRGRATATRPLEYGPAHDPAADEGQRHRTWLSRRLPLMVRRPRRRLRGRRGLPRSLLVVGRRGLPTLINGRASPTDPAGLGRPRDGKTAVESTEVVPLRAAE